MNGNNGTGAITTTGAPANAYQQGADWLTRAGNQIGRFEGGLLQNINDYINPYYENVISNTLGRMGDERTTALNQVGDAAASAGAFGGSRHGLVESDVYSNFDRNMTEYVNQANVDKFNAAQGTMAQDFGMAQNMFTGMTGLGNQYLNIGNQAQTQQAGYGQMQEQLLNQILQGNAGMWGQMTQSPYQIIDALNGILSIDPRRGAGLAQQSSTPGLFDYLSLGAQAVSGTNFG